MRIYGLIGFPLAHSFSPSYFSEKFEKENIQDAQYRAFPLERIELLPSLLESHPDLKGINVTIPYKQQVMRYVDEMDVTAQAVGAVNTIRITGEGDHKKLTGYNTDVHGFEKALLPYLKPHHNKALVLGTGGAAKAVNYVLQKLGIQYLIVSRKVINDQTMAYDTITDQVIRNYKLIVNTTPLGMFPEIDLFPHLPYDQLTSDHLLFDLVYNPEETIFLTKGRTAGAVVAGGIRMLEYQADRSWEIWNSP